ncbi:MAG: aminomethyl-transferring glycine dehydrogenase, partial [Erysipelotrichaceae bacterium]|nr:aminomethyl-transferring glycine dehydrogenase [Erysipelotrichaceae bacterium]
MSSYVVNTKQQQQEMLKELGYDSFNALFVSTGIKKQLDTELALPQGASELEVFQELKALSLTNKVYPLIFRGAGAYRHYIPSIVRHITSREEFVSAYTPYQAEISQGILQAIFEYQTMICELTGMDVSNASVYDGASAAAEAINMCVDKDHDQVLLSDSLNPEVLATVKTYYQFADLAFSLIANQDGVIDHDSLKRLVSDKTACIVLGYPNYYGCIEDIQ